MAKKKTKDMVKIPGYNPERTIFLFGEICTATTNTFIEKLNEFLIIGDGLPIDVVINSEGGSIYEGFAIHDLIRSSPVPIHTYGLGVVMSCATLILAAGHSRAMYPNSWIMIHEPWMANAELRAGELKAELQHTQVLTHRFLELYSKYTKKAVTTIYTDLDGQTVYLSASEAIDYGFADYIVDTK